MRRLIVAILLSLVCGYVAAAGNDWYVSRDFHCFWAGGRIVAQGGDPYDAATFEEIVSQGRPDRAAAIARCDDRFAYPLWTALLLVPFGALRHPIAATLWMALLVMATAVGITWSWVMGRGARLALRLADPGVAGRLLRTLLARSGRRAVRPTDARDGCRHCPRAGTET